MSAENSEHYKCLRRGHPEYRECGKPLGDRGTALEPAEELTSLSRLLTGGRGSFCLSQPFPPQHSAVCVLPKLRRAIKMISVKTAVRSALIRLPVVVNYSLDVATHASAILWAADQSLYVLPLLAQCSVGDI